MFYKSKVQLIKRKVRLGNRVLDVGFTGHGITEFDKSWPHAAIKSITSDVWGLDLDYDENKYPPPNYLKASAENFDFPVKFDVIFAGDLIEHLSNCGLFLDSCKRNLAPGGRLILTTPNAFNLFNLVEKLTKYEPTTNPDHTCYFNHKTLKKLLEKNGWGAAEQDYLYTLDITSFQESFKKKILNAFYWVLSKFTDKFGETLVVVAVPTI